MDNYERLYEQSEDAKVQFIGFVTNNARYDFGIVYTKQFFGKPLVICMQTGRSTVLSAEDVTNMEHLQEVFRIPTKEEAEVLSSFLQESLPLMPMESQY